MSPCRSGSYNINYNYDFKPYLMVVFVLSEAECLLKVVQEVSKLKINEQNDSLLEGY
jgi:hypothetical protein